ncbi:MAG: RebB family R body protein [Sneathiella sp.]
MTQNKNSKNDESSSSNSVITDSVIALNQIVLGSAASTAMSTMYISMAHAAGVGAQNSVANQQHQNILGTAAIAAGVGNLLWEGLTRDVSQITMKDRLHYWQEMMSIAEGKKAEEEDAQASEGDQKAADEAETKSASANTEKQPAAEGEKG